MAGQVGKVGRASMYGTCNETENGGRIGRKTGVWVTGGIDVIQTVLRCYSDCIKSHYI